jgi:16S rRNA G1207 methylase RsmC
VVKQADIHEGHAVLEPSAGEGALAHIAVSEYAGIVDCHEIDAKRVAVLRSCETFVVNQGDFLEAVPTPVYDRVVMNPPFAKRADIRHVTHARKFLKPDGKLVAIMSAGVAFREDALAREFRDQCETIEPLPEGAFKESGTAVRTVVVTMKAAA